MAISPLKHSLCALVLATAYAGLSPCASGDEERSRTPRVLKPATASISLHEGGILYGQLLNAQRHPLANQDVRVLSEGKLLVALRTDSNGRFGVRDLRGGFYTLESANVKQVVQLWAPRTAPPSTSQVATLVEGSNTLVRGQHDGPVHRHLHNLIHHGSPAKKLIVAGLAAGGAYWAIDHNEPGT